MSALEDRLRSALRIALRERNAVAMSALRSTLAALANATAVQSVPLAPGADEHVAGSVAGLGAAEVPRRELTEDEAAAIVRAEIAERTAAAEPVRPVARGRPAAGGGRAARPLPRLIQPLRFVGRLRRAGSSPGSAASRVPLSRDRSLPPSRAALNRPRGSRSRAPARAGGPGRR